MVDSQDAKSSQGFSGLRSSRHQSLQAAPPWLRKFQLVVAEVFPGMGPNPRTRSGSFRRDTFAKQRNSHGRPDYQKLLAFGWRSRGVRNRAWQRGPRISRFCRLSFNVEYRLSIALMQLQRSLPPRLCNEESRQIFSESSSSHAWLGQKVSPENKRLPCRSRACSFLPSCAFNLRRRSALEASSLKGSGI